MNEARGLERLRHERLVDDARVPETGMVSTGVTHERQRLDPAHQRVGEKAVALRDGGTVIGMRDLEHERQKVLSNLEGAISHRIGLQYPTSYCKPDLPLNHPSDTHVWL